MANTTPPLVRYGTMYEALGIPGRESLMLLSAAYRIHLEGLKSSKKLKKDLYEDLKAIDFKSVDSIARHYEKILNVGTSLGKLENENSELFGEYSVVRLFNNLVKKHEELLKEIAKLRGNDNTIDYISDSLNDNERLSTKIKAFGTFLESDVGKRIEEIQKKKVDHLLIEKVVPINEGINIALLDVLVENLLKSSSLLSHVWNEQIRESLEHNEAQIEESAPIIGFASGFFGFLSLVLLMKSGTGLQVSTHASVNMIIRTINSFLRNSIQVVKVVDKTASVAHQALSSSGVLHWLPIAGFVLSLVGVSLDISHIARINAEHIKNLELFEKAFSDQNKFRSETVVLSAEQKKQREKLLENISLKMVLKNPELITVLFTSEEFNKFVKPKLLEHATQERDKQVKKFAIRIIFCLAIVALSIAIFCVPFLGPSLGLAILGLTIGKFVLDLYLEHTEFKPKQATKIEKSAFETLGKNIAAVVGNVTQIIPQELVAAGVDADADTPDEVDDNHSPLVSTLFNALVHTDGHDEQREVRLPNAVADNEDEEDEEDEEGEGDTEGRVPRL